ncbi:MAG: hypothetical protein SWZ49_31555 [Cyanobacteriota bacterium]|nr:hypothetical protein [Cyanobacteriota bacterium]
MSDSADMFKKLAQSRLKSTQAKEETKTESEIKPVPESKPPKKTKAKEETSAKKTTPEPTSEEKPPAIATSEPNKKRGRPATGKRSDPDWIGRTFYIRKETDFDIEDELIKLKRAGINLDKSELVDFLLAAWVKWRKGENIDFYISEISPRQKDELS